jgi:hypothetical protein
MERIFVEVPDTKDVKSGRNLDQDTKEKEQEREHMKLSQISQAFTQDCNWMLHASQALAHLAPFQRMKNGEHMIRKINGIDRNTSKQNEE